MEYILNLLADPVAWAALATLVAMEVVLGIDNLIFIAVLTNKLPEHQRSRANARKSKVRARIEHAFGEQKHRMGLTIRTIGLARAAATITLANMACNMKRWCWLDSQTTPA